MKKHLVRSFLVILALVLLSACSEMKVIGDAAMREFKAEGMSVEWPASRVAKN